MLVSDIKEWETYCVSEDASSKLSRLLFNQYNVQQRPREVWNCKVVLLQRFTMICMYQRRHLSNMMESVNTNVYSLEVSLFGYKPNQKTDKIIPYTEENCKNTSTS